MTFFADGALSLPGNTIITNDRGKQNESWLPAAVMEVPTSKLDGNSSIRHNLTPIRKRFSPSQDLTFCFLFKQLPDSCVFLLCLSNASLRPPVIYADIFEGDYWFALSPNDRSHPIWCTCAERFSLSFWQSFYFQANRNIAPSDDGTTSMIRLVTKLIHIWLPYTRLITVCRHRNQTTPPPIIGPIKSNHRIGGPTYRYRATIKRQREIVVVGIWRNLIANWRLNWTESRYENLVSIPGDTRHIKFMA